VPTLATVEGTLVHATTSTFAGRRSNVSLGRSEASVPGLVPAQAFAPTTTGALWKKEEGNVVSMREAHALGTRGRCPESTGTLRGHVLHSVQRPVHVSRHIQRAATRAGYGEQSLEGVASVEVSRSGKPAQAGGTGTGAMTARTNARLAARHRSRRKPRGRA
jgi:hypothetical protein